jgi:hypothetical protein
MYLRDMIWLRPVDDRRGVWDTRVFVLEKPRVCSRLDPARVRVSGKLRTPGDLLCGDYVDLTLDQDPRNIPVDQNFNPRYFELLKQLPSGIFFTAFQIMDVPASRMSPKKIHEDYVLTGRRLHFCVRLWT